MKHARPLLFVQPFSIKQEPLVYNKLSSINYQIIHNFLTFAAP